MPISWHSPPNALQLNPCPNSWITFTMPSEIHMYSTEFQVKNSWYAGSFAWNVL